MQPTGTPGHETCQHRVYKLSCAAFEALLARAAGRCELCGICASEVPGGKLAIDHEHRIGAQAVRGLLCPRCNQTMRRIDSEERPMTWDVAHYLLLSGHVLPPGTTRRPVDDCTTVRTARIPQDAWDELGAYGATIGRTRTDLILDFMRWAVGDPGAELHRAPRSWPAAYAARESQS
jgi:hypothetical protein